MQKHSLRQMKREATEHALADAAFELALEKGLDGFVVEEIVQRAGYSRRTFANYFSSKEVAVAAAASAVKFNETDEAIKWLHESNENMSPLDCMYKLMNMQLTTEHLHKLQQLVALSKKYPTLEPHVLSALHGLQKHAQELLLELSSEQYPEGYTHLITGAVYGAILPVLDGSLNVLLPDQPANESADAITFKQYVDSIFGCLRNGF